MYKAIGQWRCRPLHFAEGAEVVLYNAPNLMAVDLIIFMPQPVSDALMSAHGCSGVSSLATGHLLGCLADAQQAASARPSQPSFSWKRYKSHADRFDAEPLSTKFITRFGQSEISLSTPHRFTPSPTH